MALSKAQMWDRERADCLALGYQWAACPRCADEARTLLRAGNYPDAERLLDKALCMHVHLLASGPRQTGKSAIPTEAPDEPERRCVEVINHARRYVMDLHGGSLDHPALDHLEAAMVEVERVAREPRG